MKRIAAILVFVFFSFAMFPIPALGDDGTSSNQYYSGGVTFFYRVLESEGTSRVVIDNVIPEDNTTSAVIPDSINNVPVKSIPHFSYIEGFKKITHVEVPGTIKSLGSTFESCSSLISVFLNEGITKLSGDTFYNCTSLEEITLPSTLTSINGDGTFSGCKKLKNIVLPNYLKLDGYGIFSDCSSLESVNIPSNVECLDYTFAGCSNLKHVKFEEGVDDLYESFYRCSSLETIILPNSVKTITGAFNGCTKLSNVRLNDGLESIGADSFSGCSALSSIFIPDSVTSIGSRAFEPNTTLYCSKTSTAARWAQANNIPYVYDPAISLSNAVVVLDTPFITYDGSAHKPRVLLVVSGKDVLDPETDYDISYPSDCTSVGEKTITVTGKGSYTGTATGTFVILNAGAKGDTGASGPAGAAGAAGAPGNGISSISKTSSSGLVDTYTILFTDGTKTAFTVTNGSGASDGSKDGSGTSIKSIEKTGSKGLVDTYTITLSDGTTSTFEITNGANALETPVIYVDVRSKTVKASAAKKKTQSFRIGAESTSGGKLSYTVVSKNAKVSFKNGKATLKKGAKKGTYKIKVKINSAAKDNCRSSSRTVTVQFVVR